MLPIFELFCLGSLLEENALEVALLFFFFWGGVVESECFCAVR